ncbi:sucrase ferredoxin [Wenjunlia tyrosinilytica]|uniref:sucrase ferredoxin n=1 Tax=Wenjunlia tyrosinilytica TaxID=1544741 RepID=UPI0016657089|nr:sucrase ferredoxin [Wenjunlia tyrosinilytica]
MSTCATAARELHEPLAATAATARTWLLVEQPGPWGAKALTSSHLDRAVGRRLETSADGTGTRVALVRRPGRHADVHRPDRHEVIVAHTVPGRAWVRRATVADPEQLTSLDLAALGRGDHGGFGREHRGDPLALVCTNGKRDRCCALLGRPLAAELAAMGGAEVWEITHIGGHRFAPTMLALPHGYAYGRLSAHAAKDVLLATREGRVVLERCRGRSAWDRPGQAAELVVRERTGEDRADTLAVEETAAEDGRWTVAVRHEDGRRWSVVVEQRAQEPPRPESCGKAPGRPGRMVVRSVAEGRSSP